MPTVIYWSKSKKSYTFHIGRDRCGKEGRPVLYVLGKARPQGTDRHPQGGTGHEPGDTLVLLADTKKGIALQTADKLNPLLRRVFQQLPGDEEAEE